jgi:hypothetical protein
MASVTVDQRQFEAFKEDVARQYFDEIDQPVMAMFRQQVPVDTGLLQSRHRRLQIFRQRGVWVARYVAPTGYDIFVHQGTGEFAVGVTHAAVRVRSLQARVLVRSHRGQRPNPWLYRSLVRLGFQQPRWIRQR